MKIVFSRLGALGVAAVLFLSLAGELSAQNGAVVASAKPSSPEELSPAELLKSYLQLREQLQARQMAIASSRIEAEVTARAQAAAVGEKLDGLKTAMEAERERRRVEAEKNQAQLAEGQRQQFELQRSNRLVLWVAAVFGGMALLAIIVGPLLQWRAMNRLVQVVAARPPLPAAATPSLLPAETGGLSDQTVAVSSQRIQGALERMERRIFELEHTASRPPGTSALATTSTVINGEPARRPLVSNDHATRIKLLLGKGQSLLDTGKAREALACYNEILKLDLNHPEALVKQGAALERLKQDDEAIQCYDRAIKADSRMTLAYLYKGGVCNRLERFEEASKCYEQALRTEDDKRTAAYVEV